MTIQISATSFLEILARSQLVSNHQLAEIRERFQHVPEDALHARTIARWLVAKRYVTAWQADKLLQAKHRGFFLGPYELIYRVARGGMSTIYAGKLRATGEIHALKVLPVSRIHEASYLPRFRREAEVTKRLRHPNIVRVYDVHSASDGRHDIHFMAMELLSGRDLAAVVSSDGPLPVRLAATYIQQAAVGLQYAHSAGLVHRDIKPGNLFVCTDQVVRILDLGLASDFESEQNLTRDYNERVLGTADYLAPEQAVDSHTADARADIYSLGCTFYFLLSGKPPFSEGTLLQRVIAHQKAPVPDIADLRPDVPAILRALLNEMLQKNRENRIQSAGEVADRLQSWLMEPDPQTTPVPVMPTLESLQSDVNHQAADPVAPELFPARTSDPDSPRPDTTLTIRPPAVAVPLRRQPHFWGLLFLALLMFPAGVMTSVIWPDLAPSIRMWLKDSRLTQEVFHRISHSTTAPERHGL